MNTYLAITIGPIYKTLLKSHRTREIWMGSYLFSVVMENIRMTASDKGDIVLPTEATIQNKKTGAGIYPDRLIMTLSEANLGIDVQKDVIDAALKEVSIELAISLGNLKNYLQIHFLVISETDLQKFPYTDKDGVNIPSFIFRLNYLLDNLELNAQYQGSTDGFFKDFFDHPTRRKFIEKAFDEKKKDFASVLEISAKDKLSPEVLELMYKDELNSEEEEIVSKAIVGLPKAHKYMAILRGDGDNFGKVVGELSKQGTDAVKAFSEKLSAYSEKIAQKIKVYGGTVIYIGGDDVLCFLPVEYKGKTVFTLIAELNAFFHETFTDPIYKEKKVSMSYGMSICYWKYPLNEALDLSFKLLNFEAKKSEGKNCLAYQILLHSGQYRKVLLPFATQYENLLGMLSSFTENDQLLQSLTHKFVEDVEIFKAIFSHANYSERLVGYFDNHFDENDARRSESVRDFVKAVRTLTLSTFEQMKYIHSEMKDMEKKAKFDTVAETLNQVNTICRTLKFLMIQTEQDDE